MTSRRIILIFLLSFLLVFAAGSCASAGQKIDFARLEKSLTDGVSASRNIQLMLENAWQNGYDYCRIAQVDDSDSFVIEVAVRGLAAPLKALDNTNSPQDTKALLEARDTLLSHCLSVIELLQVNNPQELQFSFVLLDDVKALEKQYTIGTALATIKVINGRPAKITSIIGAWNQPITAQNLSATASNESTDAAAEQEPTYMLNTGTRRFHYPTCSSVMHTKEANRKEFFGTRDELISKGYTPCGNCNP